MFKSISIIEMTNRYLKLIINNDSFLSILYHLSNCPLSWPLSKSLYAWHFAPNSVLQIINSHIGILLKIFLEMGVFFFFFKFNGVTHPLWVELLRVTPPKKKNLPPVRLACGMSGKILKFWWNYFK